MQDTPAASPLRPLGHLTAVLRGRALPYLRPDGQAGGMSAITKSPVNGPVAVGPLGLEGDEQGDLHVHGGPDKALHQYPQEHYAAWRAELGAQEVLETPGAFGENLASIGLTEATVCWADQVRIGTCLLELAQSRQPCWKLNTRFATADMALRVQTSGRTGWYWRVLQAGTLQAGDTITLVHRPHPEWPLTRVIALLYERELRPAVLHSFAALNLPPSWQRLVQRRLQSAQVEDWSARVQG